MENETLDLIAIRDALETQYFPGIYEGNLALLESVLNPGALLFGDVKGTAYAKTRDIYLDGVRNRQSPRDSGRPFKGSVISIAAINSIAMARVTVQMYEFLYDEFLSFHKIEGRWVIVNKMITDVSK